MPLYIAIMALARCLILDMTGMDVWKVIGVSAAARILAVAVLVIRYGYIKSPHAEPPEKGAETDFMPGQSLLPANRVPRG